jgi:hypothetical protein
LKFRKAVDRFGCTMLCGSKTGYYRLPGTVHFLQWHVDPTQKNFDLFWWKRSKNQKKKGGGSNSRPPPGKGLLLTTFFPAPVVPVSFHSLGSSKPLFLGESRAFFYKRNSGISSGYAGGFCSSSLKLAGYFNDFHIQLPFLILKRLERQFQ